MPAVTSNSKILVTGGSGFLGAWIIKRLLESGFSVKATVRSPSKAEYLQNLYKDYTTKLEFTIVQDIVAPGAFDEAVQGVDAIIHAASPLAREESGLDPKLNIEPAIQGTVGILKSAYKAPGIQRVVITSSIAATAEPKEGAYVYTETDWNQTAPKIVEAQGVDSPPFLVYVASKSLAERAAWDWVKEAKPKFDLVTLMPSFIWGQVINSNTSDPRGSNAVLLDGLKKTALAAMKPEDFLKEDSFADVRDISTHHLLALTVPEAGGERFILSAASLSWQQIFDVINANPVEGITVPRGTPDPQRSHQIQRSWSSKKAERVLGATFLPLEDTIHETLVQALNLGWTQ